MSRRLSPQFCIVKGGLVILSQATHVPNDSMCTPNYGTTTTYIKNMLSPWLHLYPLIIYSFVINMPAYVTSARAIVGNDTQMIAMHNDCKHPPINHGNQKQH